MPNDLKEKLGNATVVDTVDEAELDQVLYARHAEIKSMEDLTRQSGTTIPALFSQFYKFIQNPSTVSVETFKRMIDTDDTIGSGVDFLITCLSARLGRYVHPNKEVTEWVNKALDHIDGGFFNVVKELLGATWAGFMVAEKVWANEELGFVVKKVVSLPPVTMLFETERTGELTEDGVLQYQKNFNPGGGAYGLNFMYGFSGSRRPDPFAKLGDLAFPLRTGNIWNYLSVRIPREKCIHYAFDATGKLGNPYGRSLLRRAYKWWVMKDAFSQMLSIALDRKGTPLTVVFADAAATIADPTKIDPRNANVARGQPSFGIRADKAASEAFKNIHNDSTIILPGKKDQIYSLDFVPQASNASDFMAAIDLCNRSIMRALLIPALIFTGGDGAGSYALGQEHAKTFDKILDGINAGARQVLIHQLIAQMIRFNFPRSVWEKDGFGDFGKRELSPEEVEKEMKVVEMGVNCGVIDPTDLKDLNQVRDKIGYEARTTPIRTEEDMMGPEDDEDGGPEGGNNNKKDENS